MTEAVRDTEEIVLLGADGEALGTAPKRASHHRDTPLHLAFSSYLVDESGRVLITQRAHDKATFPSVWTNSCCGHPGPGETLRDAVRRRVRSELGLEVDELTLVLPRFAYRATMDNGVMENERCPVVRARASGPLRPDPAEVAATEWRTWSECAALSHHPHASPWFREQMNELLPLGEPFDWPAAAPADLPPAVSW
ncbi:MAG TPA: isopentenyl-diphosphate Delta-isomerase [Streptosporangiaceae bacterium]|jgi:isopentenyl-diphosphate delta-isomerase